jgi:hypothetical protein
MVFWTHRTATAPIGQAAKKPITMPLYSIAISNFYVVCFSKTAGKVTNFLTENTANMYKKIRLAADFFILT